MPSFQIVKLLPNVDGSCAACGCHVARGSDVAMRTTRSSAYYEQVCLACALKQKGYGDLVEDARAAEYSSRTSNPASWYREDRPAPGDPTAAPRSTPISGHPVRTPSRPQDGPGESHPPDARMSGAGRS